MAKNKALKSQFFHKTGNHVLSSAAHAEHMSSASAGLRSPSHSGGKQIRIHGFKYTQRVPEWKTLVQGGMPMLYIKEIFLVRKEGIVSVYGISIVVS